MRKHSKPCLVVVMQPSCALPPPRSTCINCQSASFSHNQTAVASFLSLRSNQRLTTIPTLLHPKFQFAAFQEMLQAYVQYRRNSIHACEGVGQCRAVTDAFHSLNFGPKGT